MSRSRANRSRRDQQRQLSQLSHGKNGLLARGREIGPSITDTLKRVNWLLPSMVIVASALAVLPLVSLVRRSVSLPQLLAEAFAVTLTVIAAFWLG